MLRNLALVPVWKPNGYGLEYRFKLDLSGPSLFRHEPSRLDIYEQLLDCQLKMVKAKSTGTWISWIVCTKIRERIINDLEVYYLLDKQNKTITSVRSAKHRRFVHIFRRRLWTLFLDTSIWIEWGYTQIWLVKCFAGRVTGFFFNGNDFRIWF